MESFSSCSLYSGPLSQSAQKVLAALRAQSLLPAARNHYRHSRQIDRYNGHQREPASQGSWSRTQEERTGRVPERPWSRPQSYSSSSYRASSSLSERPQPTSTYSQNSQPYAPAYSQTPSLTPDSSQAPAYSQTPSLAPDSSQAPAPSTPRDRFSLSLHTPQTLTRDSFWNASTKMIEPTFTLTFSPESSEPDGLFFLRAANPVPHIEEPALAFDETPAELQMSLMPDIHTPDQLRGEGYAMIGGGDCLSPQHDIEEPYPSENLEKKNFGLNPMQEAFSGGEDNGLPQGSGSGIKWQFGSLLRLRSDLTQNEALSDMPVYEPMRMQGNDNGAGARSDRRKELMVRKELNNVNKDQKFIFRRGTLSEKDQGNAALELDDYTEAVGSTNWIEEELAIDFNKESGVARKPFPISVTDQMDTTLDCDTQDSNLCPTAKQSKRGDDLGHHQSQGFHQDQCLHTGTKIAEEPTARVEAKKSQDVSHCTAPQTSPYQAAEPCQAEEMVTEPRENHGVENPLILVEPLENPSADNPAAQKDPTEWTLLFSDPVTIEDLGPTREEVSRDGNAKRGVEVERKRSSLKEEVTKGKEEPMETDPGSGLEPEPSVLGGHLVLRMSQEGGARGLGFRPPLLCRTPPSKTSHCHRDNYQAVDKGSKKRGSDENPLPGNPSGSGPNFPPKLALAVTPTRLARVLEDGQHFARSHPHQPAAPPKPPLLTPPFAFKRKHETGLSQNTLPSSKGDSFPRRPIKWKPPRSSQGEQGRAGGPEGRGPLTSTPKPTNSTLAFMPEPRGKIKKILQHTEQAKIQLPSDPDRQELPSKELELHSSMEGSSCETHRPSRTSKPSKPKRSKPAPGQDPIGPDTERNSACRGAGQFKVACLTTSITSDPRVKDAGKCSPEERCAMLEEVGRARALVVTMVFQDGSTQLDPEQKLSPSVCGLLVLVKGSLDQSGPDDSLGAQDSLLYLRLEHTPAWAQQEAQTSQHLFTREVLLQMVSGSQLVVCYKAKDLLRTALLHYRQDLSWKQVAACRIQDPQVSGWLLDPSDPASCYHDLLAKHCRRPPGKPAMALESRKVSQAISSLCLLYTLNLELGSKLRSQGLWELYFTMELSMIPVLAAMESHRIHVDKEALKRTSEMLGTKMKQLEQDAHQAAGQMFLVSSSTQLRTVLFEKLRLHERCENKKLPKTVNKQQQSTSEATLLQLQDLHPLPKIIIEYRQVHKIKSTFVDGVLSCMMSKSYISPAWHQTSAVTGRISAKHPNFQALPRQPVQITKKQYIQGKEAEVVTVHPRAMFVSQDGWTFLAADFCQVELRLLAHLSCDPELLKIFNDPRADVFTMLASQWKGLSEAEVTSEQREHAKRIVYSVVYGAGRERLSGILGVSAEQASQFQDSFLQTYKEVQAFIHRTIQQCHKQGYVVSIMGRRRSLPHIHSSDWGVRMQAERQAVNFVVQGSAADICKMAMIRIFSQVTSSSSLSARLVAQLHDELLYEVEDSQVENFAVLLKTTMESLQHLDCLRVHLKVPLKVAVSSGKSWGSMSELHVGSESGSV